MSDSQLCAACHGAKAFLDYNPVEFAMVPRKCVLCGGTGMAPLPKRHVPNPTQTLGLAAKSYAAYVLNCKEAGMKAVGSNTWSTWRKRAGTVQVRYRKRPPA